MGGKQADRFNGERLAVNPNNGGARLEIPVCQTP
jgi:hypothetical protein